LFGQQQMARIPCFRTIPFLLTHFFLFLGLIKLQYWIHDNLIKWGVLNQVSSTTFLKGYCMCCCGTNHLDYQPIPCAGSRGGRYKRLNNLRQLINDKYQNATVYSYVMSSVYRDGNSLRHRGSGPNWQGHCARANTSCGLTLAVNKGHGLQDFPMCVLVMEKMF